MLSGATIALSMTRTFEFTGLRYPRSLLKLLLLAFGLVSLPLILALFNAAAYVDRLNSRSQAAVEQAAEAARGSRVLTEQVTAMERLARQFLILGDPALLVDYAKVRGRFTRIASDMSLLPLDESQLHELNKTIEKEQALHAQLQAKRDKHADKRPLIEGYVELSELANNVLYESNLLIDREIENMGASARRAQRSLLWQLGASILLGLLIAALFAILIAKPIRQLDHAIRQLGSAEFNTGIQVRGPADLEYLGKRLEWLRQRLVELEQQKARFLQHVSHELKTPLTAIREGSELLADGTSGALNSQQGEIAEILRHNGLRLQQLIEGLLNYQRALDSVTRLDLQPIDLAEIVKNAVRAHKLEAGARNLNLLLRTAPAQLVADADKMRIAVDNLISNAIKYSPDGGAIFVSVRTQGKTVVVEIIDSGPGIAVEDRERVFDWFFQGKSGHQGRIKGSGLGLAIAREFALAHEGSIEVVDDHAPGAHFRMSVPTTLTQRQDQ
jgi:two-component system, NtrC family, sensor histidine kinase GlrK